MSVRPELPRGTVTLLAANIDDAPRIAASLGAAHAEVLARYRAVIRAALERHDGVDVDSHGEAVLAAFGRARDATAAAADALSELQAVTLPDGSVLPVRIGVHSGEPTLTETGYVGIDVHRTARICSAAAVGQIVLSQSTQSLVGDLPVRDLGEHRLRDLARAERLFELVTEVDTGETHGSGATLRPTPTGLPTPPTRIVGREDDHQRVAELLRGIRVVTLTGPGGIGKTRLAIDVASELGDVFPDGVFWVSLSPVTESELIPSVVAKAIGAPAEGEGLHRHLRDRSLLLLLDNLEQIPDAGEQVAALLAAGPRVRVLATSRRPLHLSGEVEVPLEPLPLTASVELFLDRARAVRPDVGRDADIEAICTRLDGMPLALELVAPQLRHLVASQLSVRLDRALDIAARGSDLPERQRTLRATIDWSANLLDENARLVLERLAVFAASCTLAAAEAVVGTDDVDVLNGIQSLADASLLRLSTAPQASSEPRYFMFETVREYALDRLRERGEEQTFRRRHAEWFLKLTWDVRAVATLAGISEIHADRANLRAALGWALEPGGDGTLGFRLAFGVWRYWAETGSMGEARAWLDKALAAPHDVEAALEIRALDVSAFLAYHQGDLERAWATNARAIERARTLSDQPRVLGWASLRAAEMAHGAGQFDRVGTHLDDAIAAFEAAHYPLALAWCHAEVHLGQLLTCRFDAARDGFARVVAESELLDELDPWAYAKVCLGSALALDGDGVGGLPHLETGIETLVDLDARFTLVAGIPPSRGGVRAGGRAAARARDARDGAADRPRRRDRPARGRAAGRHRPPSRHRRPAARGRAVERERRRYDALRPRPGAALGAAAQRPRGRRADNARRRATLGGPRHGRRVEHTRGDPRRARHAGARVNERLPAGTVTLLSTDIEGSTRLLDRLGPKYEDLLAEHHALLREAIRGQGGVVVATEGDAFLAAFARAHDALAGAIAAQRALVHHVWPDDVRVRVRMGVHTGEPAVVGGEYVGVDVHRAVRICEAGHGAQILLSRTTAGLTSDVTLLALGEVRLRDLTEPEELFQVVANGLPASFPPPRSLNRTNLPTQPMRLIGRRAELERAVDLLRSDTRLLTLQGSPARARPGLRCRSRRSSSTTSRTGCSGSHCPGRGRRPCARRGQRCARPAGVAGSADRAPSGALDSPAARQLRARARCRAAGLRDPVHVTGDQGARHDACTAPRRGRGRARGPSPTRGGRRRAVRGTRPRDPPRVRARRDDGGDLPTA